MRKEYRVLVWCVQDDALERLAWEITVQDANAEESQRGEIIVLTLGAGEWGAVSCPLTPAICGRQCFGSAA